MPESDAMKGGKDTQPESKDDIHAIACDNHHATIDAVSNDSSPGSKQEAWQHRSYQPETQEEGRVGELNNLDTLPQILGRDANETNNIEEKKESKR